MKIITLKKRIIFAVMIMMGSSFIIGQAWAESLYPRQQVERHLRTMFPDDQMDDVAKQYRLIEFFVSGSTARTSCFGWC